VSKLRVAADVGATRAPHKVCSDLVDKSVGGTNQPGTQVSTGGGGTPKASNLESDRLPALPPPPIRSSIWAAQCRHNAGTMIFADLTAGACIRSQLKQSYIRR
jgi:hypothetical protein